MNSLFTNVENYIILFPILFAVGIIVFSLIAHKKRIEKLQNIASELGLEFKEQEAITQPTQVDKWQRENDLWELSGTYRGIPIRIFAHSISHARNRTVLTYVVASFKKSFTGNLNISADNNFYKFVSFILPQELKVGDESLDNKYFLQGDSADKMRSFLKLKGVENALDELFTFSNLISVHSDGIWAQTTGHLTDIHKMREILDFITSKVRIFEEAQQRESY